MNIRNKSRKVIGIENKALLPGESTTLTEEQSNNPMVQYYIENGILISDKSIRTKADVDSTLISEDEKAEIEKAAIAKYLEERKALANVETERDSQIKTVKAIKKKEELVEKATSMQIEVNDSDTIDTLKEKIIAVLSA